MKDFADYNRELKVHDSSQISEIFYDTISGEMMVKFMNGGTYVYEDVNPQTFGALCWTPSVGTYFNNIKRSLRGTKVS